MFKSMLIAAIAVPSSPLCAPVLAEQTTSPKPVVVASVPAKSSNTTPPATMFSALVGGESNPPSMSLYEVGVTNNIACRNAARSKFFELGARDMSTSDNNAQWGIVNNMRAVVWCRDTRAIIAVAGQNYDSVREVREALQKAF